MQWQFIFKGWKSLAKVQLPKKPLLEKGQGCRREGWVLSTHQHHHNFTKIDLCSMGFNQIHGFNGMAAISRNLEDDTSLKYRWVHNKNEIFHVFCQSSFLQSGWITTICNKTSPCICGDSDPHLHWITGDGSHYLTKVNFHKKLQCNTEMSVLSLNCASASQITYLSAAICTNTK